MTRPLVALFSLLAAGSAEAQVSAEFQAGAAGSGILVEDAIVNLVTIRPAIGPSIGLGIMTTFAGPFHAAARIGWAHSNLEREELDTKTTVLPLTVWSAMVGVGVRLSRTVRAEGRFGAIKYAPGGETDGTLFQDESPLAATLGVGARFEQRLTPRWAIGLQGAIDLHQFETRALRTAGFLGARTVHRVTIGATVRWGTDHDDAN